MRRRHAPPRSGLRLALRVLVAAAGPVVLAAPARADDTEPIRIEVRAPAGCPDTDAFVAEVTARTARARPASPGEAARTFTVTLRASGKRAEGTLRIDDPRGGGGGTRTVAGDSCGEVASALALVTALAIDPKASTAAKPPPRPPAPPRPRPVELPKNPRSIPPYAAIPWWGPIGMPLPVMPEEGVPPRWGFGAYLQGGAVSAIAPGLTPVLGVSAEVRRAFAGILAPAFRVSLLQAESGEDPVGMVPLLRARFRWTAARLEGCPVRFAVVGPVAVFPCVSFEAGALDASGASPFVPTGTLSTAVRTGQVRPWAAPGLLGHVQIATFGDLLLELSGGATFPLVRDTFHFGPPPPDPRGVTAHAVPVAGGSVSGGVGMHFP